MTQLIIAWLSLRILYAWMFLYPLVALLRDFPGTVKLVGLVIPFAKREAAYLMVCVMLVGSLMILLGVYAQIGGILLCCYSLIGVKVHYKLAHQVQETVFSAQVNEQDRESLQAVIHLGVLGNMTSAQKNYVLAAVGFFIFLLGAGPLSLTQNLF